MTTTTQQVPSAVIELVEAVKGGPELYAEAAALAATKTRLDAGATVPLVQCKPWCMYGDGHPGEWTREDQWCSTFTHTANASLMPEEKWTDGTMQRPTVEVTGQQFPDEAAIVAIDLDGSSLLRLTPEEALALAAALTSTARLVCPSKLDGQTGNDR